MRTYCTWRTNFTGAQMGHPMPAWVCIIASTTPEKFCSHWVYCSNFCARADLFFRRWESYFDFTAFTISTTASAWFAHCRNNASSKGMSARTKPAFSIACCCIDGLLSVSWLQDIAFLTYGCWLRCDDDIGGSCGFTAKYLSHTGLNIIWKSVEGFSEPELKQLQCCDYPIPSLSCLVRKCCASSMPQGRQKASLASLGMM